MARQTVTLTGSFGRDAGKVYQITEKSALETERWAQRAYLVMARHGLTVPQDIESMGYAGLIALGMTAAFEGLQHEEVSPLLDEMLDCVQRKETMVTRALLPDDIEEVPTIVQLRAEVFRLHGGFSAVAFLFPKRTATSGTGES